MNSSNVVLGRSPVQFCPATRPKARKLHVRAASDDQGASKLGSYASKLEQARKEGRGTDPSQVNPLHPQSATWLRQDQDSFGAAEQEDDGWEDDEFDDIVDDTSSHLDDFSGSDLDDDDEDEEEEPDPYGFRANIQALVDNPGKSSMQVRDLPTPEAASISGKQRQKLPAFNNQEPEVARQDFTFNNQSAGSRAGSASHGAEARPNRGLSDVVESRKSRSRSFAALVQVGQQAVDHDQQARSGRKDDAAERPELLPNNAWLKKTDGGALSGGGWYDAEGRRGGSPGERETGDDWSAPVSAPEGRNRRGPLQDSSRKWQDYQSDERKGPARSSSFSGGQQSRGSQQRTGFRKVRDTDFADQRGGAPVSSSKWSDDSDSGSGWFDGGSQIDDANKSDYGYGNEHNQQRGGEEDPWQSRWLEDPGASGRSFSDAGQMARDMKPRKQKRHTSKASTRETPDFAHLLELAAKPAEERAQRQSGPVKGPAADFYQAADFLMTRLTIGVEGERQEAVDAQQRVYSRRSIELLRTAGVVVTHLQGKNTGQIFTEFLWEFTVASDADLKGATYEMEEAATLEGDKNDQSTSASKTVLDVRASRQGANSASRPTAESTHADKDEERGPKRRLVPVHVFRKGDPVLLIQAREDGSLPDFQKHPDLKEMHPALGAQVRAVGRTFIKVSVTRDVHEFLLQAGSEQQWRMDKTVQETTVNRQLQAISMLDKPFAYLERQNALQAGRDAKAPDSRAEITSGLDKLLEEHNEQRQRGFFSKEFREGELRIRHILLGVSGNKAFTGAEPDNGSTAAALAAKVPYWAMVDGYQQEAKKLLVEQFVEDQANKLNRSQIHAISHSLSATLSLWQGPPGTGKTRTLLGLLIMISKLGHWLEEAHGIKLGPVLACADTNAATDNILEGLYRRGVDVVRLGRPSNVRDELHEATLENKAQLHPIGIEALKKREQADEMFAQRREEAAEFDSAAANVVEEDHFKRRQIKLMNKARALEADSRNLMLFAQRDVLSKAEVVTGTCSGAGDTDILTTMRFTVVVLDEATQSTEPSTLIPLLRGAESVVMAGDPNQLPPTVLSHTGRAASLDTTLFDRLQGSEVRPMLLDTQYRMHPSIASFPSQMFYDGKLRSGIKTSDRPAPQGFPWPNPDCPVAMVECDHGKEQRGMLKAGRLREADSLAPGASSYFNIEEARLAVRAFEMLISAQDAASGAILSPYNGQVKLIRNLLKQSSIKGKVVVSSVDGYQGREADVIVFSSVRCNPDGLLGFVSDERRLNVAITRPRRGLVVVGSPDTLSSDQRWRLWLSWVRDHGGFLSPQALRLTDEERAAGFFDPQIAPVSPREEAEESDLTWEVPSGIDPDDGDERALASFEVGKADIADDWYS